MANPTTGTSTPYYWQPTTVGTFTNFTATTNGLLVKSGEGVLYHIQINTPTAGSVITLYDGTSTGGTTIGTITIPSSPQLETLFFDVYFKTGLFVVVATQSCDFTISYR